MNSSPETIVAVAFIHVVTSSLLPKQLKHSSGHLLSFSLVWLPSLVAKCRCKTVGSIKFDSTTCAGRSRNSALGLGPILPSLGL